MIKPCRSLRSLKYISNASFRYIYLSCITALTMLLTPIAISTITLITRAFYYRGGYEDGIKEGVTRMALHRGYEDGITEGVTRMALQRGSAYYYIFKSYKYIYLL